MEWQKVIGFLGKKDKNTGRDVTSVQFSKKSFEKAYRAWLIKECTYLTDVPLGPVNGFPELTDLYCQPRLQRLEPPPSLPRTSETQSASLKETMAQHKQLLIVAPSGYGKTTLCHFLALKAASFTSDFEEETLPFVIPLKVLNQSQNLDLTENDLTIENILKLALPEHLALTKQAQELTEDKLNTSKCLFLFDGLDDIVNDGLRQRSFLAIDKFAKEHANHYVVITSSQKSIAEDIYTNTFFASYSLVPLSPSDIQDYINKHFNYLTKCIEINQALTPLDFIQKVEANPKLAQLCQSPMMLCMLLALYTDKVALETEQAALFESYLKQSLLWYTPQGCHPSHWQIALERIAYTMYKNAAPSIQSNWCKKILMSELDNLNNSLTPDELDMLLVACKSQRSIFKVTHYTEDEIPDIYENTQLEFSHKSFQNFLTAKQLHQKGQKGLISIKSNGLRTWDQEVLLFYTMLAKGTVIKADELIHWLLSADVGKKEALLFASDIALQSDTVSNIVVERILDNLDNLESIDKGYLSPSIEIVLKNLATKYSIERDVLLTRS